MSSTQLTNAKDNSNVIPRSKSRERKRRKQSFASSVQQANEKLKEDIQALKHIWRFHMAKLS